MDSNAQTSSSDIPQSFNPPPQPPQPVESPPVVPFQQPPMPAEQVVTYPTEPEPVVPPVQHSNRMLYVFGIIALLIIIGGGTYLLLSKNTVGPVTKISQSSPTIAPISPTVPMVTPITAQNADQQLDSTTNSVDQSLQQATQDVNSVGQIDSSQDNVSSVQ